MVGAIQSGTNNAVNAMTNTREQAGKTLEIAQGSGEALSGITESLIKINEKNLIIATATEQQAQVLREVDRNLNHIRDLSSETVEGANQTALATTELSTLAINLNRLTKQFIMRWR